jgi:hypothetical protein
VTTPVTVDRRAGPRSVVARRGTPFALHRRMMRFAAIGILVVMACGSKSTKHRPPPGEIGDVTVTKQGDESVVSDEVSGYEMHLPGDPHAMEYKSDEPGGSRPGRALTSKLPDGSAVGIHIVRLTRADYDPKAVHKHYELMMDNMRGAGMEVSDVHDVTIGGLSGLQLAFRDDHFTAREWTAIDPESDTSYVIMWSPADKPEPALDAYVQTFRHAR